MKASLCVEAAERPQWTTLLVEYSGEFRTGTRVGRAKLVQDWSDILYQCPKLLQSGNCFGISPHLLCGKIDHAHLLIAGIWLPRRSMSGRDRLSSPGLKQLCYLETAMSLY